MKKSIALTLVLTLCLSLCACGKADKHEEMKQDDTYAEVVQTPVEMTETEPMEMTEAPTEPQIVEVEITLDNWQEYFEFKEFLFCLNNEFGEFKEYAFYWCLVPKESIGTVKKSTVVLGYDYKLESRAFTVYPDTNTFEWGAFSNGFNTELGSDTESVTWLDMVRVYSNGEIDIFGAQLKHMFGNTKSIEHSFYYTFDVTRIQGTLTIQKNS